MNKKIFMKSTLTALSLVLISAVGFGTAYGYGSSGSSSSSSGSYSSGGGGWYVPVPVVTVATPRVLGAETFLFTKDLRMGMQDNEVMELQKLLRAEGFFKHPTDTGYFGPVTFEALKAFQAAHPGIGYVTGYFGPLTRAEING